MLIFNVCLINVLNILLKKVMIQRYYSVLHVWWSTPLQWAITLPYSIVRWQDVHSTLWWHILKFGHGRKMSDIRIMPFLSYPEWLLYSYSDFGQVIEHICDWQIQLFEGLYYVYVLHTFYFWFLPMLVLWRSRPGVTFYLHCSSIRLIIGQEWGWGPLTGLNPQ